MIVDRAIYRDGVRQDDGSAPPAFCSGGASPSATPGSMPIHLLRAVNPNTAEVDDLTELKG